MKFFTMSVYYYSKSINELQNNCIDGELLPIEIELNPEYKRFIDLFSQMDFDLQYDWKLNESELNELKNLQKLNRFLVKKIK